MGEVAEKKSVQRQAIEMLQDDQSLSLAEVGRQLGVSREYIRQVADDILGASRHRIKYCSGCGKRIMSRQWPYAYRMGFCLKCWLTEQERRQQERWLGKRIMFTCELCGREFYREKSEVRYKMRMHIALPKYCSRQCWAGRRTPLCLGCGQPMRRVVSYICDNCESARESEK